MNNRFFGLNAALPLTGLTLVLVSTIAIAQKAPDTSEAKPLPPTVTVAPATTPKEMAVAARSQEEIHPDLQGEEEAFEDASPLRVGDSALGLLAMQREGVVASPIARPIAGDVAHRSYDRYLKSFEFAIPERFNSTVKSKSDSGGR